MRERLLHYKILGKLGQGGMGEVYRALDTKLGREVAIKVLPEDFVGSPERRARFEREARAVAALRHPNIVTIYSTEEAEGAVFLTMEMVQGVPLSQVVPRDGLELDRLLRLAVPLADALASAHRSGVIHRDLKPDNILVDERNQPRVLDFGLAKLAASHLDDDTLVADQEATGAGQVLGTAYYMSPEQAEGRESDARSDVFSLGILLYQMATGRRPFEGDSAVTTMSAIVKEQPRPLLDLRGDLPREFERIVARCLEKEPERRYESALGLRNDLERLERETIVESAISSSTSRAPVRRRRWGLWVSVSAVILLATVAAVMVSRVFQSSPAGPDSPPAETVSVPPDARIMVAVLPFENLGAAQDEYFADGITEEITSRLAMVQGLGVISRTSALQYKGSSKSLREIGGELGVQYILEGTVRWNRSGGTSRVRITPQLIQVSDDTHLWADHYERTLDDIFEVQADIATRVLENLDVTLMASAKARFETRPTENMEAYQLYLRAKDLEQRPGYSGETIREAQALARQAVELDPTFAAAHARLSSMTSRLYQFGYDRTPEAVEAALRSAEEAIRLDPDLAEGYVALAQYHYWCHRDYESALTALARAEELNPGDLEARSTVAWIWRRQGKLAQAFDRLKSVLALSPRDQGMMIDVASIAAALGDAQAAESLISRGRAIDPSSPDSYFVAAFVHLELGDVEAAKRDMAACPVSDVPWALWARALTAFADGDPQAVVDLLAAYPVTSLDTHAEAVPLSALMGRAYSALGQESPARFAFETARSLQSERVAEHPEDFRFYGPLAYIEAHLGNCDASAAAAKKCEELAPLPRDFWGNSVAQAWLVGAYATCGQTDAAFAKLRELIEAPNMVRSFVWPRWVALLPESLRDDPRVQELPTANDGREREAGSRP